MILVDTSVWIDHFRNGVEHLAAALDTGQVLMHPFVLGEIACGSLSDRQEILQLMAELPLAPVVTDTEALLFIDEHALMGRGIGYIDVHLLASAVLGQDVELWTRDRRLARIAAEIEIAFRR